MADTGGFPLINTSGISKCLTPFCDTRNTTIPDWRFYYTSVVLSFTCHAKWRLIVSLKYWTLIG